LPKIDWNKIEKSNALILKENESINIQFLDNGSQETTDIIDKRTGKQKTVDNYVFQVINLNNDSEKEYSTLSMTLMNYLKPFNPLKDKKMSIRKFRTGVTDFDIDFEIRLIG